MLLASPVALPLYRGGLPPALMPGFVLLSNMGYGLSRKGSGPVSRPSSRGPNLKGGGTSPLSLLGTSSPDNVFDRFRNRSGVGEFQAKAAPCEAAGTTQAKDGLMCRRPTGTSQVLGTGRKCQTNMCPHQESFCDLQHHQNETIQQHKTLANDFKSDVNEMVW